MGAFGNHEVIERYENLPRVSKSLGFGVFLLRVVRLALYVLAGITIYNQQLSYTFIILLLIVSINTSVRR